MRRIRGALGAAVLMILLAGCWPVPGQNPDRTGFNAFESAITPSNVGTLTRRWAFPATPTGRPILDPAVSTGGVHVSGGGCSFATLDPATGAVRWTGTPISSACSIPPSLGGLGTLEPWVDGDVVYVGWEVTVLSQPGPPRPPSCASGTDGFDVDTGAGAGHLSDGALTVRRGLTIGTTRCTSDQNGTFTRTDNLRHLEGDAGFTFPARTMERATVGTFGMPQLFVGANGSVQAYDTGFGGDDCGPGTTTACLRWETPVDGNATRPVLWGQGQKVFVAAGSTVYGIDGNGGGIEWTGKLGAPASAAPALADGVLYVPTSDGHLVAFAQSGCGGVATCEPLWSASAGGAITEQPAVGGGVVYTGSADGSLHGFAAAGCQPAQTCPALWTATTDGSAITGGPIVAAGHVYAGTTKGQLFAFTLP